MAAAVGAAAIALGVTVYPVENYTIGHRFDSTDHINYASRATHSASVAVAAVGATLGLSGVVSALRGRKTRV